MFNLDNRTILVCQIIVSIVVSSFSFIPGNNSNRDKLRGFRISNISFIAGFSLLFFQGVLPGFITVILSNSLIILYFIISSHIIVGLFTNSSGRVFNSLVFSINFILFLIFLYLVPNTYFRIITISALIILTLCKAIYLIIRGVVIRGDHLKLFIIGIFAFYVFMLITRIILTTQLHLNIKSIFSPDIATSIIFLSTIAYHTGANIGIFIRLLHINENKLESKINLIKDSHSDIKEINSIITLGNKSRITEDLYSKVNSFISRRFNVTSMVIYSVDLDSNKLKAVSFNNIATEIFNELKELNIDDKSITGRAVLENRPQFLNVTDYPDNQFKTYLLDNGYYELISYPINSKKGIIGVFTLGIKKRPNYIKEDHEFFALICDQIGTIFENLNLYSELEDLATTDHLTKILNRRSFDEIFVHLYKKNRRSSIPISIVMIDIDHFKSINDTYGHDTGDMVLVKTVDIINSIKRESDIFARYGGEEFILLLDGNSEEEALLSGERIREAIMYSKFDIGSKSISITVSLGISHIYNDDTDPYNSVTRADKALYIAKNSGRNNSVIFRP